MKKIVSLLILVLAIFLPCAVSAHEVESEEQVNFANESEVLPRGFVVTIAADIYEEDGYICGLAHNAFAIGFSRVYTAVLLYSSDTYTENKDEMTYESHNSIDDLNFGNTITTKTKKTSSKWWRCVVKFKQDSSDWKYVETATAYF